MSIATTIIDDVYSGNADDGRKRLFYNVSLTNPYTAAGERITVSSIFPNKFLGGSLMSINQQVTAANAGIASTATFIGDASSTSVVLLQLFNAGLSGTASAGLFVDNTVANLSGTTFVVQMIGY